MEPSLFVKEEEDAYIVDAGCVHAAVPKNKNVILRDVTVDGRVQVTDADLVLQLEERSVKDGVLIQKQCRTQERLSRFLLRSRDQFA